MDLIEISKDINEKACDYKIGRYSTMKFAKRSRKKPLKNP